MPTVLHRLSAWAGETPHSVAQTFKKNGTWNQITAQEYCQRVYYLALFLESRGISKQDIGVIFSANCYQWVHIDLAMLLLGGKSAGLYPNSNPKDVQYILKHTEARVLSVQNREFFNKTLDGSGQAALPSHVELLIVFDGDTSISPKAVAYDHAVEEGKKIAENKSKTLKQFLDQIDPNAGAFMIYTSGTTGNPKGAILSHDNLAFTADAAVKEWNLPYQRGSLFSFLPLCHIAEKIQSVGVGITQRYTVNFCTKFDNLSTELPEIQPTLLLCVPRLWEKMMEGVLKKVESSPAPRKALAKWAMDVGARVAEAKYSGKSPSMADAIQLQIANRLVLSKVRHALGLGKAEVLASGAAALPAHVCRWFRALGLEILEDFGQTESTGVIFMTVKGVDCAGTVGKPVVMIEAKLADDGEIITRGRHVFKGYFKDDLATQQVLVDGWLHTGDLGEFDSRGFVKIRGRKKEILKTSGGKMVAPLPIEETLKAVPMISQVCMVGDGRKYLSVLVTLSEGKMAELKEKGVSFDGPTIQDPETVKEVRKAIDDVNESLASYEQIKKFAILSKEFSVVDEEMTPTLKMKRNVIERRYQDIINRFYEKE